MAFSLREIRDEDLELIMNWRMDPDITRFMNTNPKLTIEGQKKWLESSKKNEKVMNWLVLVDGKPAGLINLADIDWISKTSSWGYYIGDKSARSLALAISLELSLKEYVFDVLGFKELHNEAFSINDGVIKLHIACGDEVSQIVEGEVEKEGVKYDVTHLSITRERWEQIRINKKYNRIDFEVSGIGMLDFTPHHVGYAVASINSAIKHYSDIGYTLMSGPVRDSYRNVNIAFLKNGTVCIELIEPAGEQSPVTEILKDKKNVSTPYHICYETDSLVRSINILKRKGYYVTANPEVAPAIENRKVAFLLNKDVGLIELLER